MTGRITVRAAAKINLHLGVGAPRPDGFHPLETVYQAISLYDDVTLDEAREGIRTEGTEHVDLSSVPDDDGNVAVRAARLVCDVAGRERAPGIAIHKSIPVAGGMAGGSADAAAALVAADRLLGTELSDGRLLALAAELGSDVPFALIGGTALGVGRGEQVEPLEDSGTWWWVVVPSAEGLSTPEVYRHWDRMFPDASATPACSAPLRSALKTGEPVQLGGVLHNDLEAAAIDLRPGLGDLITRGEAEGALRGIVSGSGPTCLFLCAGPDEARAVAGALAGDTTPLVAHGPVAGAHVLEL